MRVRCGFAEPASRLGRQALRGRGGRAPGYRYHNIPLWDNNLQGSSTPKTFARSIGRVRSPLPSLGSVSVAAPIRVTHVVHEFEGGGLETLVAAMARGFDSAQIRSSVISLSGQIGRLGRDLSGILDEMIAVRSLPLASMVFPLHLVRALRRTQCDVVHIHSGVWFKAAIAARLARIRGVVFTEHGREHHDPRLSRWLDRSASRITDAVVAVSPRLELYLRDAVGVSSRRLLTIENGVDVSRFSPAPPSPAARAAFSIPPGALVVGSVGRLEAVKAYDRVLRALAIARDRGALGQPVHVLLCGDGSQRYPLADLARSLGLADLVHFPGWVADPVDAYRMMDVFVLPSISEGLSVSLLEAMATGAVPLVTPVGANREVLGDDLASQVVAAEDLEPFAAALGATLASAGRRRELSALGRSRVVTCFSQDRMLDAYARLYRRVIGRDELAA